MKTILFSTLIAISSITSCFATVEKSQEIHSLKPVSVYLIGTGVVGSALLDQIEKNQQKFRDNFSLDIRVVALANSRTVHLDPQGIDLKTWRTTSGDFFSWNSFFVQMLNSPCNNPVFVDCTSNPQIADSYPEILRAGIPIVTPNKKANSGTWEQYRALRESGTAFLYDANVGAGLPILNTVQGLQRSGDPILKIEAVLSGTLSYLFNSFEEGTSFSELVHDAQMKGYTEPDPRDDLNGMDVARKLLILAREAGYPLEMADIQLDKFLPDACFEAPSIDAFYDKLRDYDPILIEMRRKEQTAGKRLRYIASFENGKASVSLCAVGPEHPFYHLSGNDNIISIHTEYYSKNPLVIRGPGAGADVTAARVLEGIVRLAH